MEDKANRPFDYERFMEQEREGLKASEEVKQAINAAIAHHDLGPEAVLCMLSRLTAAYIHKMQSVCADANSRDAVEDRFHDMLEAYLASLDEQDLLAEMERERRLKTN